MKLTKEKLMEMLKKRMEMNMSDLSKEYNQTERERIEGMIREDNNLIYIIGTNWED